MNELQSHTFSDEDGQLAMEFARDALATYTKEGQRMDVGSVEDLLNKRGGVIVQLEAIDGFGRLRGSAAIYDGRRIADSIIDATIYAASSRSLGSEIHRSELDDIRFRLALIERVIVSNDPVEDLSIGTDCPIITETIDGWLYPTKALEHNWSEQDYLERTFKKSRQNPHAWKDNPTVIAETAPFVEENPPSGSTVRDI